MLGAARLREYAPNFLALRVCELDRSPNGEHKRGRLQTYATPPNAMPFRAVKGMNDILPDEVERWQQVEAAFRDTVRLHGFSELRTPIVESTALFVRSIGEATDVVDKEMYTFERHDESLTLRPEGTAGAARAYIEHATHAREPMSRWFYIGPMFRAERPQKGRYRQFYQAGGEVYGDKGPASDAELITMLHDFFRALGIEGLDVKINSLGGADTRQRYHAALVDYFQPRIEELSEHARARLAVNPLRILDSKDPNDQRVAAGAPSILEVLDDLDRAHFAELKAQLDDLGTPYRVDPRLVRGLDYYTRTLFEIASVSGDLGAQNALVGGGRYDNLIAQLGGTAVPAIGFALGIERLLLAIPSQPKPSAVRCFFAPLGTPAIRKCLQLARDVRRMGYVAEVDGRGGSLKSMLRRADALGARCAIVLGESELSGSCAVLKDLALHTQQTVQLAQLCSELQKLLASSAAEPPGAGT
jgi:histidyl-tRNA synthetase